MSRTRYQLELESMPGDTRPDVVRLRIALKILRRSFSFRCTKLNDTTDQPVQVSVCDLEDK